MGELQCPSAAHAYDSKPTVLSLKGNWRAVIFHSWDLPADVLSFWEDEARNYGDRGLFLLPGWFQAWWNAYGKSGLPFIIVLYSDARLKGIFPCWVASDGVLSGMASGGYFDFLLDVSDRATTLDKFLETLARSGHCTADLPKLSRLEGNGAALLEALRRGHFPFWFWAESWAPVVDLSGITWEELERKFESQLRNSLRKGRNRVVKEGILKFEEVRNTDSLDQILDEALAVEGGGWKGRAGTALIQDPDKVEWFRSVCFWAAKNGFLRMYLLRLNERLIAFDMSMEFGHTVFALRTGYDEEMAKRFSPGNLMRSEVFKLLVERPDIDRFDFTGQTFPWKLAWNSSPGECIEVFIYPRSLRGWAQYIMKHGWKQPIKKVMRLVSSGKKVSGPQAAA